MTPPLTEDEFRKVAEFELSTFNPASCVCDCARCDGRGTLRITTACAEEWVPCREVGGLAYLPDRDKWKS